MNSFSVKVWIHNTKENFNQIYFELKYLFEDLTRYC